MLKACGLRATHSWTAIANYSGDSSLSDFLTWDKRQSIGGSTEISFSIIRLPLQSGG
jgi:hypothetical protein